MVFSVWFAYIYCWATDEFSLRSDPGLYNEKPTVVELRVQLWTVNQRTTEAEESLSLRFVNQKTFSENTAEE
jgi:hypothetical protein